MSDQTDTDQQPQSRQVYYKQDADGLLVSAYLASGVSIPYGATEISADEYAHELASLAAAQADNVAAQRAALEAGGT